MNVPLWQVVVRISHTGKYLALCRAQERPEPNARDCYPYYFSGGRAAGTLPMDSHSLEKITAASRLLLEKQTVYLEQGWPVHAHRRQRLCVGERAGSREPGQKDSTREVCGGEECGAEEECRNGKRG